MDNSGLALNPDEQTLISNIFSLVTRLGYSGTEEMRDLLDQSLKFDQVRVFEAGVYRLSVYNLKTEQLGEAVTYTLTFDPANKKGVLFDEYLEMVTIHLVGVNRANDKLPDYRECMVEAVFRDMKYLIKEQKRFILKANKFTHLSRKGVPWLNKEAQLTTEQALIIVEILGRGLLTPAADED